MFMQEKIIKQAVAILGSTQYITNSGNKLENAERICGVFVTSAIEEVFLSITWKEAIELIPATIGKENEFVAVAINDCIKVIAITPSSCEWYVDKKRLYFKGKELSAGFYYSDRLLNNILANQEINMPSIFITLCSLYLAAQAAHSLYSESVFTDGMKKQYLQKIEETKRLYHFDYHLIHSARFS